MPRDVPIIRETWPTSRAVWFVALAGIGCAADLATKSWLFSWPELLPLRTGKVWWLWEGHVGFQLSLNEGALFGMGQGLVWLFAALSIVAAVAIPVWLFAFGAARDRLLCFALGLVMGGVLGNLYDRLGLHGITRSTPGGDVEKVYAVRDWILLQWNDQWPWPNFNIADALLVSGACLLALHAFLHTPEKSEAGSRSGDGKLTVRP
jgi:signal peptidase II